MELPVMEMDAAAPVSMRLMPRSFAISVGLLAAVLTGCQSSDQQDLLELQARQGRTATSSHLAEERIGAGAVNVAMLLPRSLSGVPGQDAADYRDGAALAMKELGDQHLSLTIYDTAGDPPMAAAIARGAGAAGAKLIIATHAEAAAISRIGADERPPVIGLVETSPSESGLLAFVSGEIDSAAQSAAYAVAAEKKDIVAVVPRQFGDASVAELKRGIEEQGAQLLGTIKADAAGIFSTRDKDLIGRGQALLILSSEDLPQRVAAVRSIGSLRPGTLILGTSGWSAGHLKEAALEGAYIPVLEQEELKEVGTRYRAVYGRPISTAAAYAYDVIALAAGIAREMGAQGLNKKTFRQAAGFRGVTGKFRFEGDGSVRRLFSIYRIAQGSLKLVDPAPEGF